MRKDVWSPSILSPPKVTSCHHCSNFGALAKAKGMKITNQALLLTELILAPFQVSMVLQFRVPNGSYLQSQQQQLREACSARFRHLGPRDEGSRGCLAHEMT